jgi:hypothetical protein
LLYALTTIPNNLQEIHMKTFSLLTAAAVLVSATAMAESTSTHTFAGTYSNSITGVVSVNQPMCLVAPCPAIVSIKSGDKVTTMPWGSPVADDLAAFAGKTVTVNGTMVNHPELGAPGKMQFDPQAFRPGKSSDFVTGVVSASCTRDPAMFCHASIEVNGRSYPIQGDYKNYLPLNGATVTLPGSIAAWSPACNPGELCSRMMMLKFIPTAGDIMVKGQLGVLYTTLPVHPLIPRVGNYLLTFGAGNTMIVDSKKNNMDVNGDTVWISGHVNQGGGDLTSWFTATKVSAPVYNNQTPVGGVANAGNNAGRNDSTNGATQNAGATGSSDAHVGTAH